VPCAKEKDLKATNQGEKLMPNQLFYYYEPPNALEEIETDIKALESEIINLLAEVTSSGEGRK
jgi:type I restriction enzyme M protein